MIIDIQHWIVSGYDGLPVESMQGLDLNSGANSTYGGGGGDPGSPNPEYDQDLPQPPNDNNQVAAWYDTDL